MQVTEMAPVKAVAPPTSADEPRNDCSVELVCAEQDAGLTDPGPMTQPAYPVVDGFITVAREELYKRVWPEPMRTLSPKCGLSELQFTHTFRPVDCFAVYSPVPSIFDSVIFWNSARISAQCCDR